MPKKYRVNFFGVLESNFARGQSLARGEMRQGKGRSHTYDYATLIVPTPTNGGTAPNDVGRVWTRANERVFPWHMSRWVNVRPRGSRPTLRGYEACGPTRRKRKLTFKPPRAEVSSAICASCCATMFLTMASPRPLPCSRVSTPR